MIDMIDSKKYEESEWFCMELKSFGERLFWARRNQARLTQQQLRDRMFKDHGVDIGRNYVSLMETDSSTRPTFEVVRAAAAACRVSLDYLAGFTDNYAPAQSEEATPNYFSPEADEVAHMVDEMHPAQRATVLNVARGMAAQSPRQAQRSDIQAMLNSVERDLGIDARRQLEKIMRGLGMLHDPDA